MKYPAMIFDRFTANPLPQVLVPGLLIAVMFVFPVFARQNAADLIIVNANIRTMDAKRPRAEALAVSRNLIVAVGSNDEIRSLAGSGTRTIDAQGRLVLPGFNDSHVHFTAIGIQFSAIDLREVRSSGQFTEKFRYYVNFIPKGRWILGGFWDSGKWNKTERPTKELLDPITPDNPVFVYSADPQIALANSAALKTAGFDKAAKTITGGTIERTANGEPTGIIRGEAVRYMKAFTPRLATRDMRAAAITATNHAAFYGVTSVQDVHSDDNTELFRELERDGLLKTRIYDCITLPNRRQLITAGIKRAEGDSMIRRGCLKHFSDGEFEVLDQLYTEISEADKADLQVMIHAIGSRANDVVLTVFERILSANGPKDRRFRIEHAHNFALKDIERFAATGTIASMQPHLFFGGEPYRSLLESGARLAFGSDASITDINPLLGIYAAVKGDDPDALSVQEAVYAYTAGAAYAEFQENVKGTLTVGKLADLVILSDDIFEMNEDAIPQVKVLTTIVDGRVVYQKL